MIVVVSTHGALSTWGDSGCGSLSRPQGSVASRTFRQTSRDLSSPARCWRQRPPQWAPSPWTAPHGAWLRHNTTTQQHASVWPLTPSSSPAHQNDKSVSGPISSPYTHSHTLTHTDMNAHTNSSLSLSLSLSHLAVIGFFSTIGLLDYYWIYNDN